MQKPVFSSATESFESFRSFASPKLEAIEERRQKFLRRYRVRQVMTPILTLLVIAIVYWTIGAAILPFFVPIAVVFALWWMREPIFDYKRNSEMLGARLLNRKGSGLVKTESLKEMAYGDLILPFGLSYENLTDVEDLRTKGVSRTQFHDAPHIMDFNEYRAEDWVHGVINGAKVQLSEAEMIRHVDGKKICIFRGLLLIVDIDEVRTQLRGKFRGKGVLVVDAKKNNLDLRRKYEDLERFALPEKWEGQFEAYTASPNEAAHIFSDSILQILAEISRLVNNAPEQITHGDDQAFWLRSQLATTLMDKLGQIVHPKKGNAINHGGEIFDNDKFADTIDDTIMSLNRCVEASYYADRVVITIPYMQDLFEPNSLFEQAFSEYDIKLFYELMHAVTRLAEEIAAAKDAINSRHA